MSLDGNAHSGADVLIWKAAHHGNLAEQFLSGGSDSKGCFFGDFLCTSKESYPLAAGQRKLWLSKNDNKSQDTGFRLPPQ